MDLGEAIYREITSRSPHTEVTSFGGAIDWLLDAAGGKAAGAARMIGVPASTFRGWMRGREPRADRAGGVFAAALRAQRRARLPRGREHRMRRANALAGVKIVGGLHYGSGEPEPDRDVALGSYLDEVQGAVLDAYLDGAPLQELAEIFHDGINGAQFYEDTFDPDPDNPMGWEIYDLDGWA